jgi:hypothetical protein
MTIANVEAPRITTQDVELFHEAGSAIVHEVLGIDVKLSPEAATVAILMYMKGYDSGVESVIPETVQKARVKK